MHGKQLEELRENKRTCLPYAVLYTRMESSRLSEVLDTGIFKSDWLHRDVNNGNTILLADPKERDPVPEHVESMFPVASLPNFCAVVENYYKVHGNDVDGEATSERPCDARCVLVVSSAMPQFLCF